jgi:hypothetical protein
MELRSRARFPDVPAERPHYESFYLKTSRPERGLALWIRHTVLKAPGAPPRASLWVTLFDAAAGPVALKASHGADQLSADEKHYIRIADALLFPGRAIGDLHAGEAGDARWELEFEGSAPPFYYLPRAWMYERSLPKTKAISLYPALTFSGRLAIGGRELALDGWPGMIGHNWGTEHPHRGSWIEGANFSEQPDAYLDAVFGRIKLGPVLTPWLGNACLSIDGQVHRLGGPRPGSASITESHTGARFVLRGTGVTVEGEVQAPPERFVGWRYGEPGGGWHPTLNCSLADMRLRVERGSAPARELSVSGGAAYELQLREHDHGVALQPFPDP